MFLTGKYGAMEPYQPPTHRWGSILGLQDEGLRVFQPGGGETRIPRWMVERIITPLAVRRLIYGGLRPDY